MKKTGFILIREHENEIVVDAFKHVASISRYTVFDSIFLPMVEKVITTATEVLNILESQTGDDCNPYTNVYKVTFEVCRDEKKPNLVTFNKKLTVDRFMETTGKRVKARRIKNVAI